MKHISKIVLTLALAIFLTPLFLWVSTAQADVYNSYEQLANHQTKNEDYRITSSDGPFSTAVIAIHGGGIEIGTSNLAKSVAQKTDADLYTFEGIKKINNNILHITSSKFDEPIGIKIVADSTRTLSIHGCSGSSSVTYVGGKDKTLGAKIKTELIKAGFKVATPPAHLDGTNPNNIANKNKSTKGVQLELTYNLRQTLLENSTLYEKYVNALSNALN